MENSGINDIARELRLARPSRNLGSAARHHLADDSKFEKVQALVRWRAARSKILGSSMLDDPAWDILLHVYSAQLGGRPITVNDLAGPLHTSAPAIACWVDALEDEGLIARGRADHSDQEILRLTDRGYGGMHAIFEVFPAKGTR